MTSYDIISRKRISSGRFERYQNAKEVSAAMKRFCNAVKVQRKKWFQQADNNLLSAYVLDKFPLYDYQYYVEGKRHISVAIIGEAPVRDAFVKNIFACAQLPDTTLNIRVWAPDARLYADNLIENCPQLRSTTNLYLNHENTRYKAEPLDHKITTDSFANIYFYERPLDVKKIIKKFAEKGVNYYLVAGEDAKNNKKIAEELILHFEKEAQQKIFIGYGKRGNGGCEVVTELKSEKNNINIRAFCFDANITETEKLFKTEISKKALGIHTFYTKGWNEKLSKKEISKDLKEKDAAGNFYNLKSSLRSALSIKYKCAACNVISYQDMAKEFYEQVIVPYQCGQTELFDKMTWLEHRSWMCFMITEGYSRPTDKELEKYLYRDGNDHRRKHGKKLHPCISNSSYHPVKTLKDLNYSQWSDESVICDSAYDELDRTSLKLHAMCEKRVRQINLEDDFLKLEKQFEASESRTRLLELKAQLYQVYKHMLSGESNINAVWDKTCAMLEEELESEDAKNILKYIKNEMRIVKERNLFQDYKSVDATIIMAIPRLLMKEEKVYNQIYKTPSLNVGELIISTILLEPKELILLTDKDTKHIEKQKDIILSFLEKRGLEHIKVSHCSLEKMKPKKSGVKNGQAILDITGASPKFMMELIKDAKVGKMPIVRCENGKVVSEINAEEVRYYMQPRHMTVEENFELYGAKIFSNKHENYMLTLGSVYQLLWKVYMEIEDQQAWYELVDFLTATERDNYWKLQKPKQTEEEQTYYTNLVHRDYVYTSRIDLVLKELKERGYVQDYEIPFYAAEEGSIRVKGCKVMFDLVERMISKVKDGERHKFTIVISNTGNYIYDDTLVVTRTLEDDSNIKLLKTVLIKLYMCGDPQNGFALSKLRNRDIVAVSRSGEVTVAFKFSSKMVKQCFMQNGNILEAYTYHTIMQKGHFDDVKLNVQFYWDASKKISNNEIDLVCTKGMQIFFISCKQGKPESGFLTEIKYYADYLGMNAKAIIICSSKDVGQESAILDRSELMDVYFVSRKMIGENMEDIKTGKLAKIIDNIADGKEVWWEIE